MWSIQEHQAEIEEVAAKTECHFNFECLKSDLEHISKICVEHIPKVYSEFDAEFLWCIDCFGDDEKKSCNYRLFCDEHYLCQCPLRQYIADNLHK